jgi:hypothetical protein
MSHGLKMSKIFSKGHYGSLQYVQPYWQRARNLPSELDVTIVTTTTPDSWKDLVVLAENWDGKLCLVVRRKAYMKLTKNCTEQDPFQLHYMYLKTTKA